MGTQLLTVVLRLTICALHLLGRLYRHQEGPVPAPVALVLGGRGGKTVAALPESMNESRIQRTHLATGIVAEEEKRMFLREEKEILVHRWTSTPKRNVY